MGRSWHHDLLFKRFFKFRFSWPPSLTSVVGRHRPTSANVGQSHQCQAFLYGVKSKSSVVENVGQRVKSPTVEKLFLVPVYWLPSWIGSQQRRTTSTLSCRAEMRQLRRLTNIHDTVGVVVKRKMSRQISCKFCSYILHENISNKRLNSCWFIL